MERVFYQETTKNRVTAIQYPSPPPPSQTSCCSMQDHLTLWTTPVPLSNSAVSLGASLIMLSYLPCARNEVTMDWKTPIIKEEYAKLQEKTIVCMNHMPVTVLLYTVKVPKQQNTGKNPSDLAKVQLCWILFQQLTNLVTDFTICNQVTDPLNSFF